MSGRGAVDLSDGGRRLSKRFEEWCESPAELAFARELLDYPQAEERGRYLWFPFFGPSAAVCMPQVPISIAGAGRLRLDFLFWVEREDGRREPPVVVEIDGFDWHERTMDQAERDRRRDRTLLIHGFRVIRFTGREALRHPETCVDQTEEALAYASSLAVSHGTWPELRRSLWRGVAS